MQLNVLCNATEMGYVGETDGISIKSIVQLAMIPKLFLFLVIEKKVQCLPKMLTGEIER